MHPKPTYPIYAPKSFGPKHTYSDLTHLLKYLQFDTEGSEQLVHILEISISNDFTTFEETKVHWRLHNSSRITFNSNNHVAPYLH